jgi:OmpA-OmpF porin, OOP family
MKKPILFFIFHFITTFLFSQVKMSGEWQGLMIQNGDSIKNGKPVYFSFYLVNGLLEGKFRQEVYSKTDYSVARLTGTVTSKKKIDFQLKSFSKSKNSELFNCLFKFNLSYNDTTGYIEGTYSNAKCPNLGGKVAIYKSKYEFKESGPPLVSHNWIDRFISDLENGLSTYEIRQIELKNFQIEPVYFDYDKDIIKMEYRSYLTKMVKIVKSHSDIRVKITGNTDSHGSDNYNNKLSKRRAEAIILFFQEQGLTMDRIFFDFRGEKKPIKSNKTSEGRKKNRRVDFEFI